LTAWMNTIIGRATETDVRRFQLYVSVWGFGCQDPTPWTSVYL
jgi:hypothetical protein